MTTIYVICCSLVCEGRDRTNDRHTLKDESKDPRSLERRIRSTRFLSEALPTKRKCLRKYRYQKISQKMRVPENISEKTSLGVDECSIQKQDTHESRRKK